MSLYSQTSFGLETGDVFFWSLRSLVGACESRIEVNDVTLISVLVGLVVDAMAELGRSGVCRL